MRTNKLIGQCCYIKNGDIITINNKTFKVNGITHFKDIGRFKLNNIKETFKYKDVNNITFANKNKIINNIFKYKIPLLILAMVLSITLRILYLIIKIN